MLKKIVVLTSGGDSPGMNAAIRAVVRTGCYHGLSVFGCPQGFEGLIKQKLVPLFPETLANCIQMGGTILKAGRCPAFLDKTVRDKARAFLQQEQIDGLIVIGGNGSFKGASLLSQEGGPRTIGIPGTIDNDILNTDYTIGFDTARNTALLAIDKIRDTASSHDRHFLVEVMGRNSGFLALDVGIAGGAEFVLLPEIPLSMEALAKRITHPPRVKQSSIMVIAEADQPGRSMQIADELCKMTGMQYRVCILGHTQRGGSPTLLDRKVASMMGYFAVISLLEGASHHMVGMNQDKMELFPIPDADLGARRLTNFELVDLNDILCI